MSVTNVTEFRYEHDLIRAHTWTPGNGARYRGFPALEDAAAAGTPREPSGRPPHGSAAGKSALRKSLKFSSAAARP